MTRWQAVDELQQAGVSVFVSMSPTYPTMGEDDFHELLSYLRALGEVVVFHEPINPRGTNFQQMQDSHQYWVEYALEQLNTVQQVATRFDGLEVHSWPDDELVRSTSGQLPSKLTTMQEAVSPESFSTHATDASPEQSELARDGESIEHLI